jgi:nitrilase
MANIRTLSAAQMAPVFLDQAATVNKVCEYIIEAGKSDVQLVAFPESIIPGYPYWTFVHDVINGRPFSERFIKETVEIPGPTIDKISTACKKAKCATVVGVTEREGGTLYCTQVFIDANGQILGRRRKLMPTLHEKMIWGWGDGTDLQMYDMDIGKVGGLICYEHSNALYRYANQGQGEQIHIANWPGGLPGMSNIIDAMVRSYAFEGQCFVVNATAIITQEIIDVLGDGGSTNLLTAGGGYSGIVGPNAEFIAGPEETAEGLISAEIDLDMLAGLKIMVDSAGHYARPDVVRLQIDRRPQKPIVEIDFSDNVDKM